MCFVHVNCVSGCGGGGGCVGDAGACCFARDKIDTNDLRTSATNEGQLFSSRSIGISFAAAAPAGGRVRGNAGPLVALIAMSVLMYESDSVREKKRLDSEAMASGEKAR